MGWTSLPVLVLLANSIVVVQSQSTDGSALCDASTRSGFTCEITIDDDLTFHWSLVGDQLRCALVHSDLFGRWYGIAFPSTPETMVIFLHLVVVY